MRKPFACVQVDADGLRAVYRHFGMEYEREHDPLLETAIPRFLELFARFRIKATFFVIGSDLRRPERAALFREAVRRGHEIANHSMNHCEGFSFLSKTRKQEEIAEAESAIMETLGVRPQGFRAPSYDVDAETLAILEKDGYVYDSSLLPTFYGPFLKTCKFVGLSLPHRRYLGLPVYGLAPRHPYNPDACQIWRKGSLKIRELPVTTMPLLRLPFHSSFALAAHRFGLGTGLFGLGYALHRISGQPFNLVFHACELSDPLREPNLLRRQLSLFLPLKEKLKFCENILKTVTQDYSIVTSSLLARTA